MFLPLGIKKGKKNSAFKPIVHKKRQFLADESKRRFLVRNLVD